MRKALLLLVVLAGFVAGCENKYKDPDPQAMGYDYYPLAIGDYRIYDVTDIRFRENRGDTSRFQVRERVDTSFYDQTNQLVYKIVRSIRFRNSSPWLDDSVMVVAKLDNMVLLTKDNTKYVKLVFPVKEGGKWVGDLFNNRMSDDASEVNTRNGKDVFTYSHVGEEYSIGSQTYPTTALVMQKNSSSDVNLDDRKEVYAEGIGLVHRAFNRIIYCRDSESKTCPYAQGYKLQGHERHEVLVEHGKL